jgi:hypothetical protein
MSQRDFIHETNASRTPSKLSKKNRQEYKRFPPAPNEEQQIGWRER